MKAWRWHLTGWVAFALTLWAVDMIGTEMSDAEVANSRFIVLIFGFTAAGLAFSKT